MTTARTKRVFIAGSWRDVRINAPTAAKVPAHGNQAAQRGAKLARIDAATRAARSKPFTPAKCSCCQKVTDAAKVKGGQCPDCQSLQRSRALDQAEGTAIRCQCLDCRAFFASADREADHCPKCARERRMAEVEGVEYVRPLRPPRREFSALSLPTTETR